MTLAMFASCLFCGHRPSPHPFPRSWKRHATTALDNDTATPLHSCFRRQTIGTGDDGAGGFHLRSENSVMLEIKQLVGLHEVLGSLRLRVGRLRIRGYHCTLFPNLDPEGIDTFITKKINCEISRVSCLIHFVSDHLWTLDT